MTERRDQTRCTNPRCYAHDGELCAEGHMHREQCPRWCAAALCDPKGHPIRAIEYHGEHPHAVIVDDGGDKHYDFEWCKRDEMLFWHVSGGGPKTPTIELCRMGFPEISPARLWLAPGEAVTVNEVPPRALDEAGIRAAGYTLITELPPNPFEPANDVWEEECYECPTCDDWLPHDRPCEHLCEECDEPAPQLLAGYCGTCCDVELDGKRIWKGSHSQWVVRFDSWGEPYGELLEE